MLETPVVSLLDPVVGATVPSTLPSVGGFPLLELAAAALTVVAGIWLMLRADRDKRAAPALQQPLPDGVRMFFDGPLVIALRELQAISALLREATGNQQRTIQGIEYANRATDRTNDLIERFERGVQLQTELMEKILRVVDGIERAKPERHG